MAGKKWFKWTVELAVEQSWVADGFNLTEERAQEMLADTLPGAYNSELKAKILAAPPLAEILRKQGYTGKGLKVEAAKIRKEARRGR
jgi:hypothetical protein